MFGFIFIFTSFEASLVRHIVNYITVFLSGIFILIGLNGTLGLEVWVKYLIIGFVSILYILRIMQKVNIESVENFMSNYDQKNKFELII